MCCRLLCTIGITMKCSTLRQPSHNFRVISNLIFALSIHIILQARFNITVKGLSARISPLHTAHRGTRGCLTKFHTASKSVYLTVRIKNYLWLCNTDLQTWLMDPACWQSSYTILPCTQFLEGSLFRYHFLRNTTTVQTHNKHVPGKCTTLVTHKTKSDLELSYGNKQEMTW